MTPTPLGTSTQYRLLGTDVTDGRKIVGRWFPEQSRIQWFWSALGVDKAVLDVSHREAALWDKWADTGAVTPQATLDHRTRFSIAGWRKRYPDIDRALESAGIVFDLCGKTVLDVGGTGKDMVYWLRSVPARIDHVEVSAKSQFLCNLRVRGGHDSESGSLVQIYYHTVPAENLPFDEHSFDFVFSRATIHHCRRPDVFRQLVRVLRPGGTLLFVEPHLSDALHWLMRARRGLLKLNRGTDNPLRFQELRELERILCQGHAAASAHIFSGSILRLLRLGRVSEDWTTLPRQAALMVTFAGRKTCVRTA